MTWQDLLRVADVTHLLLVALLLVQYVFVYRLLRWHPSLMYGLVLLAVWLVTLLHTFRPAFPQTLAEAVAIYSVSTGAGPFSRRRLALTVVAVIGTGLVAAWLPAAWWQAGELAAVAMLFAAAHRCPSDRSIYQALKVASLLLAATAILHLIGGPDARTQLAGAVFRSGAYIALLLGGYQTLFRSHRTAADVFVLLGVDFAALMGALDEVVYVMDPDGHLLYVSDAIRQYGITPDDLRGSNWAEIADPEPPPPPIDEELRLPIFGLRHRETGELHWLEESSRLAQVGGRWLAIGTLRDVTRRIALEKRLLASTRLAAIGELSSGIAHNFNNLLAGISVRAEHLLLLASRSGNDRLQAGLEAILENTRRGADITRKLLTFARGEPVNLQPMPLLRPVQEALDVVGPERLRGVQVRVDVPVSLQVSADEGQLQQVLVNLVLNAVQAMPNGGQLHITGQTLGNRGYLQVRDTGVGIPPDNLARIFEPFFTTKRESQQGTGLGLSVSLGMLRAMGGDLLVESRLGEGSTFTLVLPVAPA